MITTLIQFCIFLTPFFRDLGVSCLLFFLSSMLYSAREQSSATGWWSSVSMALLLRIIIIIRSYCKKGLVHTIWKAKWNTQECLAEWYSLCSFVISVIAEYALCPLCRERLCFILLHEQHLNRFIVTRFDAVCFVHLCIALAGSQLCSCDCNQCTESVLQHVVLLIQVRKCWSMHPLLWKIN